MSISDVIMNKQIRGCSSYPGPRAQWDVDEEFFNAPEISIFPATGKSFEIDDDTGLPKLPVEPPVPGSPEVVPRSLDQKKLASALKMSSSYSPTKRKSVTFNSSNPASLPAMSKQASDGSVVLREQQKQVKRSNGRPTSLPNRSRSVFIRLLQPPRATPTTLTHKRSAGNDPLTPDAVSPRIPEDVEQSSPVMSRASPGRRSSFLYQGTENSEERTRFLGGEPYVTPFAQILSTLHHIRADYLALVGLPEDTKTVYTRHASIGAPPPTTSEERTFPRVPTEKGAIDLLTDLDWSLKMLETVNSNQSMGNVAGDKIKRLLNRELSHLSEGSENGAQVAEWVTNITSSDPYDVEKLETRMHGRREKRNKSEVESCLSASMSHDNWTRRMKQQRDPARRVTVEAESVPKFGVEVADQHRKEMEEYMKSKLHAWNVDVFYFDVLTGGNSLVSASYLIFKRRNLFSELHISPHTFINYMTAIQNSYHSSNPYHNALHGTDVMLTSNHLLSADSLEGVFSPVEILAALVAAAVHDVDHPGVSNQFLVAIRHELAIMYNDCSVLENHHVATAFRLLQKPECNFLEHLDNDCVQLFRRAVIDMVLSTDMAKHIDNVGDMKTLIESKKLTNDGLLSLGSYKENIAVLKCVIHCADLGNPAKEPSLASLWSYRVSEESFRQGDREKELGLTIHAMGDRDATSVPRCQVTFIELVIYPLWETWAELVYPDAQYIMDSLATTKQYWMDMWKKEEGAIPSSPRILGDSKGDHDDGDAPHSPRILGSPDAGSNDQSSTSSHAAMAQPAAAKVDPSSRTSSSSSGDGLNDSADSATLVSAFEHSPASERRTSYRSMKNMPIGQSICSSLQDS